MPFACVNLCDAYIALNRLPESTAIAERAIERLPAFAVLDRGAARTTSFTS